MHGTVKTVDRHTVGCDLTGTIVSIGIVIAVFLDIFQSRHDLEYRPRRIGTLRRTIQKCTAALI